MRHPENRPTQAVETERQAGWLSKIRRFFNDLRGQESEDPAVSAPPPAAAPTATARAESTGLSRPAARAAEPASRAATKPPRAAPTPAPKAASKPARKSTAKPKPKAATKPAAARRSPSAPAVGARVEVEGLGIFALRRNGAPEAPSVVLIHGAGLDHRDWSFAFIERLPPSWNVLAFDRPGFGRSERPNVAGALPATQARLLRQAAHALGAQAPVVVGHSWGGAVAMAWALDAPEDLSGVVSLAGAVAPWSLHSTIEHTRKLKAAARLAMQPGGAALAASQALDEAFAPDSAPNGYSEHVRAPLSPLSGNAAATASDIATVNGALGIQVQRYHSCKTPVELVYGDADQVVSAEEQGGAAQRLLPHAHLSVLPGIGHMVHHSAPDACIAAIRRLAEPPARPQRAAAS